MSTASELITIGREDYLDDTVGATAGDGLVTDATFLRFLIEAQEQACRRMDLLYDETTAAICTLTLVDGTRVYLLDSRITKLERVEYDSAAIPQKTVEELNISNPTWRTDTGEPTQFVVRQRSLYPIPYPGADEDTDTLSLEVYRLPLVDLRNDSAWVLSTVTAAGSYITNTALTHYFYTTAGGTTHSSEPTWDTTVGNTTADNDVTWTCVAAIANTPEIPDEFHHALVYWALYRVYNKRDEDSFDPNKAAMFYGQFKEVFGELVAADVRIHQFENPRTLTLGVGNAYSMTQGLTAEDDDW